MKAFVVSLSLFCMTTTVAVADVVTSSVINSVQAGILCAPDPIGSVPAPNTVAGTTHIIEAEPEFVATITTVPASLGVGFGVKAQARAVDGISEVTMVVTHPPMGPDAVTLQSFQTRINGDNPSLTFYQFDYVYELVIGTWVFTAMSGDEALFSASFEVVDPRRVPELAGLCGYLDLLS